MTTTMETKQILFKNIIDIKNISKTYISGDIKVQALKKINLKIGNGERVVILGHSGSGKTTLLNLLGGITSPDENGNSNLLIFGKKIQNYNYKQLTDYRRDHIGFIFQFFNLFPTLNAVDNIVIGIDLLRKKSKNGLVDDKKDLDTNQIAIEYLEKVGLGDRLYHYPSQLSGGEQQRVAIARALAKIPFIGKDFILLCDEPTGSLDTDTGDKIIDLMKNLNDNEDITIIFVTHNVNLAKKFATKIVHLRDGNVEKEKLG